MAGNNFKIQENELGSFFSLYFHLPFCSKKCPYCHFYVTKTKKKTFETFFSSLKQEVLDKLPLFSDRVIYSIYFGGGTPSQVEIAYLKDFFDFLLSLNLSFHPEIEITFEANPEDLSISYLKELKKLPINRLSIGVQSFDDAALKELDRQHNSQKAIDAILDASIVGFENISIDLMYDLPKQTLESFKQTLNTLKTLPITHLSLYNLTIEPQTLFFKKKEELKPFIPNDDLSLKLLNAATEALESLGLHRYEISAFAKKNYHSKHNTGYWLGRDFLGFGPAAFSFFEKKRFKNISHLNKYQQGIENKESVIDFSEALEFTSSLRELFAIRLRLIEGVSINKFGTLPDELKQELESLHSEGFITINPSSIFLTKKGMLFYDTVASTII